MRIEKTRNLILCALFVALITIGTFIKIPVPMLPFTLQFLFTTLAGLLLGGKWGSISVCIYVFMGLLGFPVFTEGGGFGYILKPTFGYLIGFIVASYVTGTIANNKQNPNFKHILISNFIGLIIVYVLGMTYYYFISYLYINKSIGLWPLFFYCFILAVPGDIFLCILSAILGNKLIPLIKNGGDYR